MRNQARKHLLFILFLTLSGYTVNAQQVTISGVVSDETGPLPGVSIHIKNTTTGTETNFDGEYSITANIGDTLVYSFIGMLTVEKVITGTQNAHITMKTDVLMDVKMFGYCCCIQSQYLIVNYYSGLKYSKVGFFVDFNLPYFLRLNTDFKLGYQSNLTRTNKLLVEASINSIFNLGNPFNVIVKHSKYNIASENFYYKDYKIVLNSPVKTIFDRYTRFYVGIGSGKTNSTHAIGYEIGVQQYLSNYIGIYSTTTFWGDFWQFQNGFTADYKRFNIFVEHHKIGAYNDFNIGFGYKIYL